MKVLIQSKLEHLLAQRGLTMEDLSRRLVQRKVAPEALKKIFIGKYPSSYEVVVYLENEKNLTDILQLPIFRTLQ